MRRQKPLPTELSFKEFAKNRHKKKKSVRKKGVGRRPQEDRKQVTGDRQWVTNKIDDKHDRRGFRGKSFKEDKRQVGGRSPKTGSWKRLRTEGRRGVNNKEMFDAVCMKCGNECKVPFKPIRGKPVSCSNCFDKNKKLGRSGKSFGGDRRFSRNRRM